MDLRQIRHGLRCTGLALNARAAADRNRDTPAPWYSQDARALALSASAELAEYFRTGAGACLYRAAAGLLLAAELHTRARLAAKWNGHCEHPQNGTNIDPI